VAFAEQMHCKIVSTGCAGSQSKSLKRCFGLAAAGSLAGQEMKRRRRAKYTCTFLHPHRLHLLRDDRGAVQVGRAI
jgi:hypothetical protein